MASNDYLGVLTLVGQQKLAAAIGGAPLVLQTIRVGDGNGAQITPNEAMIDLVHRVGNGYGILSSGVDPVNAQMWRVSALVPATDGPFDIREIGVFDADGDMIAIARHPLVEKRAPGQGVSVELTTDIVFPVSSTAQITVNLSTDVAVDLARLMRTPFIAVNSISVQTPPVSPVQGDTYLVPTAPTGAWNGAVGKLAMWNGIVWRIVSAPVGTIIAASDTGRYWRRTATEWEEWVATTTRRGIVELATDAETQAGTDAERAVTPAGLTARVNALPRPPVGIQVMTASGNFTVPTGVTLIDVQMWGGGGGGGGVGTGGSAGGGGGGGYTRKLMTVTPGQVIAGVVGAGGTAGGQGGAGGTGGASAFSTLNAYGGTGGGPNPSGNGGAGGGSSGGDVNFPGGSGTAGGTGSSVPGGPGGGSPFGGVGGGAGHGIAGGGAGPGGGGGGGGSAGNISGGAGTPGLIIIRY
ncbi:phage tail protein [Pseudochelatococcus sp. G4_1912]|uniref:phage tail-collar fiber domain-containing protein n=1 Tax=Pseudochelatococcus sp. G4_1912 TaxID=3114288 RepID=UPI0039C5EBB2